MIRQVKDNVYSVGAVDWDRRLFDELIPLPDGTTYNAYLVKGNEKTALLDAVDPTKTSVLIENLVKGGVAKVDYVIAHHAEQDHTGAIPDVLGLYPEAKVVTNARCKEYLIDELQIDESRFIIIEDGQTLSLGDKTLKFVFTPWVHWPETFVTYLPEDKILFTCDFFGSHLASSGLYVEDEPRVYEAAKRYYAEIMMPFRTQIKKDLEKIKDLDFELIAPSHGPVYNKPDFIINAYKDWVSDNVKNIVIVPFTSMHGSTKKMVQYFVDALIKRGITVKQFDLTTVDIGQLAIDLVDAATVVIGSPTMLIGMHPNVAFACFLMNALRPKTKFASVIGSFAWGGKMIDQIKAMLPRLELEFIEPVIAKGYPKEKDYLSLDNLADKILDNHKRLGIVQ